MQKITLKLNAIDRNMKDLFVKFIENYWKRKMTGAEIADITDNTGIEINFAGGAPGSFREELYVIYFKKFSPELPLKMILDVTVVSGSTRHDDLLNGNAMVAGTTMNGRFSMLSSSWSSKVRAGTPAYEFGNLINLLFRQKYRI